MKVVCKIFADVCSVVTTIVPAPSVSYARDLLVVIDVAGTFGVLADGGYRQFHFQGLFFSVILFYAFDLFFKKHINFHHFYQRKDLKETMGFL
jgi:hypothetical protein